MKKRNGFTLIELLAVIVILAIIVLIAVPVILNIIDKANQSAFKDTAYGIVSAAELYFAEQQLDLDGMETDKEFSLPAQTNTIDGLQIKGEVPEGRVQINKDGEIALLIKNERYCITKGYGDSEVTLTEDLEHCYMPHTLAALSVEEVECATDKTEGACVPGTLFTLRVNNSETKNFRVLKDDGNKVTLIMSENLGSTVSWYADAKNNSYGPITAINYLDELTDEEWINIPKSNYIFVGIAEDGETRMYRDITRLMRVRMLTYAEATSDDVGCTTVEESCPSWLYENLYTSSNNLLPYGYWISTPYSHVTSAWRVRDYGHVAYISADDFSRLGVRPVIELYK